MAATPPTCPPGIRPIRPGDERGVFDLCMEAYRDNGWGGIDPTEVRSVIAKAIAGELFIIWIIPGPERIEAVIGFQPARNWYGDAASWYYQELVVFVHPSHRRSRHAATLLKFARWFEGVANAPVLICLMAREGQERKRKLLGRYGRECTNVFMIGDGTFRYAQAEAA